jgi:activator of HSP90 ATPase
MPKDIHQTVTFDAKPAQIYRALIDSKLHAAFTASPAKIDDKVGGSFTAYDKYISGVNAELVKGVRIVQAWRAADWPTGAWSVVRFELAPAGTGQTKLTFSQHGVPDDHHASITQGWKDFYWTRLSKWLGEKSATRARPARTTPAQPARTTHAQPARGAKKKAKRK